MKDINWNSVDWSKSTHRLSVELGVSISSVSYHRRSMHKRREARSGWNIDWSNVDWTKTNCRIAAAVLATPGAVASARSRFAPKDLSSGITVRGLFYNKKRGKKNIKTSDGAKAINDRQAIAQGLLNAQPNVRPSWIKRKMMSLSDWLFNLCVSDDKKVNK